MAESWTQWLQPWWSDLASFLRMGRHGPYVWSSVALTAAALGLERWLLCRRGRELDAMHNESQESDR